MNREIGIEVKSTLNMPPASEVRADIVKLRDFRKSCRDSIKSFEKQIEDQRFEKDYMQRLEKDPLGDDGITYNPEACGKAAKRCDTHICMFESLIKKERAKIEQIDYMITEIEKQLCLSEQMLALTGN